MTRFFASLFALAMVVPAAGQEPSLRIIAVVGTGGSEKFDDIFLDSAAKWKKAADLGSAELTLISKDAESEETSNREQLKTAIDECIEESPPVPP